MKLKQLLLIVLVSSASALASVWTYNRLSPEKNSGVRVPNDSLPVNYARYTGDNVAGTPVDAVDFTKAANTAVPAVVHIKTKIPAKRISNNLGRNRNFGDDWLDQFFNFGPQIQPEQRASGSGVLISDDGYIVTNNHVIADATDIQVTLDDKREFNAKIVGSDPSTDLALSLSFKKPKTFIFYTPGKLNNRRVFSLVARAVSSNVIPFISANFCAVHQTKLGSFCLPRIGIGARYGQSVSTSIRSFLTSLAAS